MKVQVEKLTINELKLGMFISQLDRPWIDTPFPLQGFLLSEQSQLDKLATLCNHVYVDYEKSPDYHFAPHAISRHSRQPTVAKRPTLDGRLGQFEPVYYETTRSLKKEVAAASLYHSEVVRTVLRVTKELRADKPLNLRAVRKAASVLVHSIVRNPDAMVWLVRLKDEDSYSYHHGVRCAILASVFGRQLGLPKSILENLATGALLMDVGLTALPRQLVQTNVDDMSDEQRQQWQRHVEFSMQRLQDCSGINDQILALVQYHHERHDGSGFPFGLQGKRIPILARIAGLVDYYDSLTSPRPGIKALTSTKAVSCLYEQRDKAFQASLIEQFIQSIGVYPTGTPVELSSGEVAVVVAQNTKRRLRPEIMLVLDRNKQPLVQPRIVDLLEKTQDVDGKPLTIEGALEASNCGFDLGALSVNAA